MLTAHWNPAITGVAMALAVAGCVVISHAASGARNRISRQEAVNRAEQATGARALSSELEREGGRTLYEVELVDQHGARLEVEIDAQTGEVVEIEPGD